MSRRSPGMQRWILAAAAAGIPALPLAAQVTSDAPGTLPDALVDLAGAEGLARVHGVWRYQDARIVPAMLGDVGADLRPSGKPHPTFDITPRAGIADFDDASWETLGPGGLLERRGSGRLCFGWYRLRVTLPEHVEDFAVAGSTVIFEVVVDDYAEVWVNGALPRDLGRTGGALIKGFNAPNRVVLTDHAEPGQTFQLAVFAANGPLSSPPENFLWVRSATLEFHQRPLVGERVPLTVETHDARLSRIVPPDAELQRVASGFQFIEGPVWDAASNTLLFSDPNANCIYRFAPHGQVTVMRSKSGYLGARPGRYHQPGSNGLAFDREGRLVVCEHGNRRVVRHERSGALTVLADRHDGKRLNSPNDLVFRSDGTLYFTDPPFGLPGVFADPDKQLPFSGVYSWKDGVVTLLARELTGPNGLAFSPDERSLYVDNWDPERKVVLKYPVRDDGTLGAGELFFSMQDAPEEEALDGLKVDRDGNLFVSGPGGVWILSPEGTHLGTLRCPELPANFAFAEADGRTLYLTARTGLYRLRLATRSLP